jgi:presenilin-like A22 family membrane protease
MATPIPVLFVALYLSPYWNIYLFNFFAIIFAVCISVYVGSLFRWKTTVGFASLLAIVDVIQVVVTRFTVVSAERALELELPIGIILPSFPYPGWTFLGLGDLFLIGLLSIQTTRKYGRRFALASIISVAVVFLLLQTVLLSSGVRSLPATVLVISGWLVALGGRYLYKSCLLEDASTVKDLDEGRL